MRKPADPHPLDDMGFRLFIDDFGTGHSSLAYVQKLPVDAIKIEVQGYYISPPLPADDFVAWSKKAPWPLDVAGADHPVQAFPVSRV